jgi:Type II CAAX prenyl endopeptidase Rce1-like
MIDFKDFISFLKNPNFVNQIKIGSISSFLKLVWSSLFIILLISIIISLIISAPLSYFKLLPSLKDVSLGPSSILKISLFVPVVEELIFRLPLRANKITVASSLGLLLFLIFKNINFYLAVSLLILLIGYLLLKIKSGSASINLVDSSLSKYFFWVFYFQAVIFGILHLTNFNLNFKYFYLFPFFIITYILTGCIWGYIRVKYTLGIYACIVTHIILNSIYCFLSYI